MVLATLWAPLVQNGVSMKTEIFFLNRGRKVSEKMVAG